jgi:hypothetical protein
MNLQEINNRMISIEERINLDEHRLNLSLGNRNIGETNHKIHLRLESLNNEWDRLMNLMSQL